MTWYFEDKALDELPSCQGFIYCITDKKTHKFYIGKKTATFTKTRQKTVTQKNGEKKKKKIKESIESDWKDYYGSNETIQEILRDDGPERFHREILLFCNTKGEMTYWESYLIFVNQAIVRPDWFYNGWVSCRVRTAHLKSVIEAVQRQQGEELG